MDNFEAYLRQGEPNKAEKAKVWKMAIGLQQVDGFKTFRIPYLNSQAEYRG